MPKVRRDAADMVRRGKTPTEAGRRFGVSASTVCKWVKKAEKIGFHPIPTRSSRPKGHPKQLSEQTIQKIVDKRLEIKRGAEVVHSDLLDEGVAVSLSSVKRTLDRRGLLKKRSPWSRLHLSEPRPNVLMPGDLVQIDTIHLMAEYGRIYVFTLIDIYSRWTYARAYAKANTRTALDFLKRARLEASFSFSMIQSDHRSRTGVLDPLHRAVRTNPQALTGKKTER